MTLGSCWCSKRHALFKGINKNLPYFLHVLPTRIKSGIKDASKSLSSYSEFGKNLYGENDTTLTGVIEIGQHFLHFLFCLDDF
jgi:hypothetical protein